MHVGVDIGGSKILVVLGSAERGIIRSHKFVTPEHADQGISEIIQAIEAVADNRSFGCICVASPGPIDRHGGRILRTPNMTWQPTPIASRLQNHFGIPTALEKDANAAALAEATVGAGRGGRYVLYVTVSTGIGTGFIIDGHIYHGAHDTEGGHMDIMAEGQNEELERAASGKALMRRFGQEGFRITDPLIWDQFARDLATGLHNLITVLSPDMVVIGGGVGVHFQKFAPSLRRHLEELRPLYPTPPVIPARFTETAVAMGTLILAERLGKTRPTAL